MKEFLTKLLAVEAPENTVLVSATFDFGSPLAWWLTGIIVIVMTLIVLFTYALERGTLGWIRRSLLILIRSALLILILLLIFRPVLLSEFQGQRTRHIVVLLDSSLSMNQQDRRVANEDIVRVAIAKGILPLDTVVEKVSKAKIDELKSNSDLPKDPPREQMVRWMLTHKDLKLIAKLQEKGPLQPWAFGARLVGLREEADPLTKKGLDQLGSTDKRNVNELLLANLKPTDEKTLLFESVDSILQRKDGDLPAAIFIITDGQDNGKRLQTSDVTKLCKQYDVPLYIYGVGSAQAASLQLKEVVTPDTLFVKDFVKIPVSWKSKGIKKGMVEIGLQIGKLDPATKKWDWEPVLDKDGKDVKKKLKVQEGLDLRDELIFPVRAKPGLKPDEVQDEIQKLKVTLELTGNELYTEKNKKDGKWTLTFSQAEVREVRVTNRKIKVLVIENFPRREFHFLQSALDPDRERRFETTYYLASAEKEVTRDHIKATPDEMRKKPFINKLDQVKQADGTWRPMTREEFFDAKFDVIVLGDVSPEQLGKQYMEWIKDFVEKFRGGLIVVAGPKHMPADYKNSLLAEVLPVEFDVKRFKDTDDRPQEYQPTLTAIGERTDMLSLDDSPAENLKIWKDPERKGFVWQYPITKLRDGATALVVNPRAKMGDKSMPLIVSHYYGKGEVLFSGTEETWRWRWNVGDKYFVRYWGQVLYHLGLPHLLGEGSKRVVFNQEQAETTLDKPGYLFVRVFDKEFNPRKDLQIEATLEQIENDKGPKVAPRTVMLRQVAGVGGKPIEGEYKVLLPNKDKGKFQIKLTNLGEQHSFTYNVETPPGHELDELGLPEKELRDLARDSGGKFYREEDLRHLADDVKQRKVEFRVRQEVVLWNPLVMLLFIALISAEWLIRKFSNLS